MVTPEFLHAKFAAAKGYREYIATGSADQRANWARSEAAVRLTEAQTALLGGFVRRMNILVLSGVWCGDCVQQCPMLHAIAEASRQAIDLRFLDRDANLDLAEPFRICGGLRVPTVLFLNEDFEFTALLGDRTLSRYRATAAQRLGGTCPAPGALPPDDERAATRQDWVNEFERVQLILRLSPKLLERYGE